MTRIPSFVATLPLPILCFLCLLPLLTAFGTMAAIVKIPATGPYPVGYARHLASRRFSSSPLALESDSIVTSAPKHVGIVGGGLAGLSAAFQLIEKVPSIDITIIDPSLPGNGGASSVAGGLLHPLSPRGKLVHLGLEGLNATNRLIEVAAQYQKNTVLRDRIVRIATSPDHVRTLRKTSLTLPQLTTWLSPQDAVKLKVFGYVEDILGALILHSGCRVVHIPSYLRGLWQACESTGSGKKEWIQDDTCCLAGFSWCDRLAEFDCVILAAGAGLFQSSIVDQSDLPVQVVRGQSVEIKLPEDMHLPNALLCGKYVSPLPQQNRVLIGATHEYKEVPLTQDQVKDELKERSYYFSSTIWNRGVVDRITAGYRAQTNRGKNGRLPIIGRFNSTIHDNAWIFTGLSSRGLLYHGIFGAELSDMILGGNNKLESFDLDWWRP